jgi:hypothetical protein
VKPVIGLIIADYAVGTYARRESLAVQLDLHEDARFFTAKCCG